MARAMICRRLRCPRCWLLPATLVAFTFAQAPGAEPGKPSLGLPLACTIQKTCWVANYIDVDSSRGARDFRCKSRTYDRHDGVDFAIRDRGVMTKGVPVLASAAGVVKNVRDGMTDVAIGDANSRSHIQGRECGNGVVIDHAGGWQTQYCHLRQGSVRVKPGERVAAGASIGLVGLSGQTEFPHLHLAVRHNGGIVDPFTARPMQAGCGKDAQPMWRNDLNLGYETVALYNAGFAAGTPDLDAIRNGDRTDGPFPVNAPALVLWVDMLGVEVGDQLRFHLTDPPGQAILEREQQIEKTQARRFVYVGKRRTSNAWAAGTYTGEVTHTRVVEGKATSKKIVTTIEIQ